MPPYSMAFSLEHYRLYEQEWDNHSELYEAFEWEIPDKFNTATYACDQWAKEENKVALIDHQDNGREYTYEEIQEAANRFANYLQSQGVEKGDIIATTASQKPEALISHIGIWKLGAVAVPINPLFGADSIQYRLSDCDTDVCIIDDALYERMESIQSDLDLDLVLNIDAKGSEFDDVDYWSSISSCSDEFDTIQTNPDDDAIIIYTSGTTGKPKGVVHGHQVMLGALSWYNLFILDMERKEQDVLYSVASWGWVAQLCMLWAPLIDGMSVVANPGEFDPTEEFDIIDSYNVTRYFNAPTGLRALKQIHTDKYSHDQMRVVASGGEKVPQEIKDWAPDAFGGAVVTEQYGYTECPPLVVFSPSLMEEKEGVSGKAVPGHNVDIVDMETAESLEETDTLGEFAVQYEEVPTAFNRYLNLPAKTDSIRKNGWQLTSDLGRKDDDGYFIYETRKDSVIISAGYRIGPGEIEESLATHEAVVNAGVIGIPDPERTEVPKAFVVLADSFGTSEKLKDELEQYVRDRLARYQYPREIEFIDDLPKTSTGKIIRADLREREGITN
jgi:acetyl-CoA synthetase